MGFGSEDSSLVDEIDGTLVDEDEILHERTSDVLIILKSGETWMQASLSFPFIQEPVESTLAIVATMASNVLACESQAKTPTTASKQLQGGDGPISSYKSPLPKEGW